MKFNVTESDNKRIEINLIHSDSSYRIFIESKSADLKISSESILSAALLPSMTTDEDIVSDIPTCPKFLFTLRNSIQGIFNFWDSAHFHKIQIIAPVDKYSKNSILNGKSACFFTGGVDSFYTLLKNKNEITDIIFVHGFDIKLEHEKLRNEVSESLRSIASSLSLNLVEIKTNLRDYLDNFVSWKFSHGAALSFIGHFLSDKYDRIFIASSYTYSMEDSFPWGSHPFLDHFWGGERLEFTLHGCETNRPDKIKFISSNEIALKYLRVCWENSFDEENLVNQYNCGKCEKCVRTMLGLFIENKLDECKTFKNHLTSKLIRKLKIREKSTHIFLLNNIKAFPVNNKNIWIYLNLIYVLLKAKIVVPLYSLKNKLRKISDKNS